MQIASVHAVFGKAGTVAVVSLSLLLTMTLTFRDRSIAGMMSVLTDDFYIKTE